MEQFAIQAHLFFFKLYSLYSQLYKIRFCTTIRSLPIDLRALRVIIVRSDISLQSVSANRE